MTMHCLFHSRTAFSIYDLQCAITGDIGKDQKGFDIEISLSFVSAA